MSTFVYLVASVAIGALVSVQPAVNATVARTLGSPLLAVCFSLAISLILGLVLWAALGGGGSLSRLTALPWWAVVGGVVGAVFVAGGVLVAPRVGVALFFVCVVAGQLLGAAVADHVGAFGLAERALSAPRLIGLAMVAVGAVVAQTGS